MIRSFSGMTPKIADSAYINEAAYIIGDVEIGEDSNVWPGAVIRGDFGKIIIGKDSSVEDNCVIHSGSPTSPIGDVIIGDNVRIGHGAVIHSRSIGNNVLIGINAVILHDVEIGDLCIIGASCLVPPGMKIPNRSFVAGIPAQIKGEPTPEQLWWVTEGAQSYANLVKQYKEQGL